MSQTGVRGLLVGVDGSEQSLEAVAWAAAEAAARHTGLTIGYVSDIGPPITLPLAPELLSGDDRQRTGILTGAAARAREIAPEVPLGCCVVSGAPAGALVRLGAGADQIVVGHRGLGGFAEVLLGSVSGHVAAHAAVPVVVVRPVTKPDGPVLVGLDGSAGGHPALEYAFDHAARHQLGVQVLHAFHDPIRASALASPVPDAGAGRTRQVAADLLAAATEAYRLQFPRVPVERIALGGPAAHALVDASLGASLVVVGRRGVAGLASLLLGSVSQAVIRHAHAPVAVVG
jgi:nucleotide-binding universal stress UspA family protein